MKVLITLLIAFTALISVEANLESDVKAFIANKTAEYSKLTELEIKVHVKSAVAEVVRMMKDASAMYRKEDLGSVAGFYDSVETFILDGVSKMWITLDKEEMKERMTNLIKMGVTIEVIKYRAELEKKSRGSNPLKVTETEENLEKKFQEVCNKTLTLTKWTVEELTKKKSLFWADIHQKIYEFLAQKLEGFDKDVKKLKTDVIRAKNLQLMVDDLTLLLSVADTRPPAKTFFEKVSNTFYELTAKLKSTFAKLNPF
jgi:hypothetical protein